MISLYYVFHKHTKKNTLTILLIHGLFGSLSNLRILAKYLKINYQILQLDLRNHGKSLHANSMYYVEMAQDIIQLLHNLKIDKFIVIGHSMGGKVAMFLCKLIPKRIIAIIVLDIAPVNYIQCNNINLIFFAIENINKINVVKRSQAFSIMKNFIKDKKVILFLLKSFCQGKWLFNFEVIQQYYAHINSWEINYSWLGQILFIKGQNSLYLSNRYHDNIFKQFPNAQIQEIIQSGHWVHFEQPTLVLNQINIFLKRVISNMK